MKPLASLIWKEWHEVRIFMWIGLGIFLGLPIVGTLEAIFMHVSHKFEILVSPWVLMFGGVLAILVAVNATCRDFHGHLDDFWRSRPVGVLRWMLTKYLVGLAVVIVSLSVPLAAELYFDRDRSVLSLMLWLPLFFAALYSVGFLAGCLLRRTTHAALLSLAIMLLVWFLPFIFPTLSWMNISTITDDFMFDSSSHLFGWPQLEFAASMIALTLLTLLAALYAVRRDMVIDPGRKLMYGSITAFVLLGLASAAFRLGTSLPILQQVDLPGNEIAQVIRMDGTQGFVMTYVINDLKVQKDAQYRYRTLRITASGIELGSPVNGDGGLEFVEAQLAYAPGNPDIRYGFEADASRDTAQPTATRLGILSLAAGSTVASLPLWTEERSLFEGTLQDAIYAWHNRLYVMHFYPWDRPGKTDLAETHLMTFDISDPLKPQLISDHPFEYRPNDYAMADKYGVFEFPDFDEFNLRLPPIADLPLTERINLALKLLWTVRHSAIEGDVLCVWTGQVSAYRLTKHSDTTATFKKIGDFPDPLPQIFGLYNPNQIELQNGFLYTTPAEWTSPFNANTTVFDTRSAHPFQPVGHFAAPGAAIVCPLPDGRAIVGGSKIWLIGPPPNRAGN